MRAGLPRRPSPSLEQRPVTRGELALALAWETALLAVRHDAARLRATAPRAREARSPPASADAVLAVDISVALVAGMNGDRRRPDAFDARSNAPVRCGDLHEQVRALVNGTVVASMLRDHAAVDRLLPPGRPSCSRSAGSTRRSTTSTQSRGRSLLDRGRLREAAALGRAAQRVATVESGLSRALEATALARLGEPERGASPRRRCAEVAGAPDGFREAVTRSACAEIAWLDGDHAAGRASTRSPGWRCR